MGKKNEQSLNKSKKKYFNLFLCTIKQQCRCTYYLLILFSSDSLIKIKNKNENNVYIYL